MTPKFTIITLLHNRCLVPPASSGQAATWYVKSIFLNGSGAPSPPEEMCSELARLHLQTKDTQKAQPNFSPASSSSARWASSSLVDQQQANARLANHRCLLMLLCGEKSLCFPPRPHKEGRKQLLTCTEGLNLGQGRGVCLA